MHLISTHNGNPILSLYTLQMRYLFSTLIPSVSKS